MEPGAHTARSRQVLGMGEWHTVVRAKLVTSLMAQRFPVRVTAYLHVAYPAAG